MRIRKLKLPVRFQILERPFRSYRLLKGKDRKRVLKRALADLERVLELYEKHIQTFPDDLNAQRRIKEASMMKYGCQRYQALEGEE